MASPSFLSVILQAPDGHYALHNGRNRRMLATQVEPAFDSRSRRRGLLGREALSEGAALIIAPCSAIHTLFMRFAIDVVALTRDFRVLRVRHRLRPFRVTSVSLKIHNILEIGAGEISRCKIEVGDQLEIV